MPTISQCSKGALLLYPVLLYRCEKIGHTAAIDVRESVVLRIERIVGFMHVGLCWRDAKRHFRMLMRSVECMAQFMGDMLVTLNGRQEKIPANLGHAMPCTLLEIPSWVMSP